MKRRRRRRLPTIGWREWLAIPEFGVERIKAKVDTGARSSALHAFEIESVSVDGEPRVRFLLHPVQRKKHPILAVEAPVVDERRVRSSSGKATLRPVVRVPVVLGGVEWPIEITLVNRDVMGFRMLLGRQAIRRRFLVDPGRSFLADKGLRRASEGGRKP